MLAKSKPPLAQTSHGKLLSAGITNGTARALRVTFPRTYIFKEKCLLVHMIIRLCSLHPHYPG
jgi:hypothetical protein